MYEKIFQELEEKGIKLNDAQMAAAVHKDGPCIVLAVPGSGKTTTMVVRIYMLIKYYNIDPKNILAMTFSKASARDMKERFCSFFQDVSCNNITFSTIHSFAYSVVRNYESVKGIKYKFTESNDNDNDNNSGMGMMRKIPILKKIYRDINLEFINEDQIEILCNDIGYVKNKMIVLKDFDKYNFKINSFSEIFIKYEEYKAHHNLIDYDDMLTIAYDKLRELPQLLNYYRERYKYVLIDEGQDTSLIQHKIIQLLAKPNDNLFIVADDDQSIYGFRASEPKELLDFKQKYKDAKIYFMEQNYRSTKNIVSLANEFIKCNKERYEKNIFTNREDGNRVEIINKKDEREQAKFLVEYFKKNENDLKNFAVLFRNNISSVILGDELEGCNIPFYMKDSKLYIFNHWITLDIQAFMNFSQNNNDVDAFERIYYRTGLFLSKSIFEYVKDNNKTSVFDTLIKCPLLTNKQRGTIYEYKARFDVLRGKSPRRAIDYIYNELKYREYLKKGGTASGYSVESLERIIYIIKIIAEKTPSFTDFSERLRKLNDIFKASINNKGKNVVTLTTIHSAKGLEYDTVFLIDLVDGEFPTYDSISKAEMEKDLTLIEEENRLFYVGITRAKNKLYIFKLSSKNGSNSVVSRYVKSTNDIINLNANVSSSQENCNQIFNLNAGDLIKHKHFGAGVVVKIKNNIVDVRFEDSDIKRLDLIICKKLDVIELN